MIGVLNYGVGNYKTLLNVLDYLGIENCEVQTVPQFDKISRLIIPGVGSFDNGMRNLLENGFDQAIEEFHNREGKILGICLGAQMMLNCSEEGSIPGLGLVSGFSKRFPNSVGHPIPLSGKFQVSFSEGSGFESFNNKRFYFVHSYYMQTENRLVSARNSEIDIDEMPYVAGFVKDHVTGVQFHPERSGLTGIEFLKAWVEFD